MESSETFLRTLEHLLKVFMHRSMRDSVLFAKQNGLSMTQIAAMLNIRRSGCSGVSCIGEELGITNAAASQMVERLVQMGLLARTEDAHDRRLKKIALTQQGEAILEGGLHARQKWLDNLVKLLSIEEQQQVTTALNLLIEKESLLDLPPSP